MNKYIIYSYPKNKKNKSFNINIQVIKEKSKQIYISALIQSSFHTNPYHNPYTYKSSHLSTIEFFPDLISAQQPPPLRMTEVNLRHYNYCIFIKKAVSLQP